MVSNNTKYIILIWIIMLIIFTFYCVFRLKYLKEKYYDTPMYNYFNRNDDTPIISLINTIEKQDKITNMAFPNECKKLYDDNIRVQSLGYNNCESAYSDYISKGFDIKNNFGQSQSLSQICPIASKSDIYNRCLGSLLNTFTDNANMVNGITTDMTNSINKRLQYRSGVLNNVQNQMNPLIYNKDQNDFNTYMKTKNAVTNYKEDVIGLVNTYYQDRYQGGVGFTGGNTNESFIASTSVYIVDPDIEKNFFGKFKPINGQFIAFNDLTISLDYEGTKPTMAKSQPIQTSAPSPTSLTSSLEKTPGLINQITNIILSINSKSNNLSIVYNIVTIDNYNALPNTVKIIISTQNIISNTNDAGTSQTILQLLSTLGITAPTQLIMTYEEFEVSGGIMHKSYKLVNDNLDTILVLNKI